MMQLDRARHTSRHPSQKQLRSSSSRSLIPCRAHAQASRRHFLIASTLALGHCSTLVPASSASADAQTQIAAATCSTIAGLKQYQSPDDGLQFLVPCSWRGVNSLDPASGILASFYNPDDPGAETLAVYVKATPAGRTEDLGSPQDIGLALAGTAAFGQLEEAAASRHVDGRSYFNARVQFSGATAGRFGAVMECRCVTVSEGLQYTLRITTTRYRWLAEPPIRQVLQDVLDSFLVAASTTGSATARAVAHVVV